MTFIGALGLVFLLERVGGGLKYLANDNGALFVADDESEREKETMPGIIYRNPEPGISLDFLLIIISGMFNLIKAGLTPGNSHLRSVGGVILRKLSPQKI